jgi:hypothetical protein
LSYALLWFRLFVEPVWIIRVVVVNAAFWKVIRQFGITLRVERDHYDEGCIQKRVLQLQQ